MISSLNDIYHQSSFSTLPPCSDVLQQHFHDRSLASRVRSASSSIIPTPATSFPQHIIKNPMSVQPPAKQIRKQNPLPTNDFDQSRTTRLNPIGNLQIFSNTPSPIQHYDDKFRKSFSSENYCQNRSVFIY
jgi:hypothetical protein